MALELGIPPDMPGACAMVAGGNWTVRPVDLGRVGENYFLVRVSSGLEADMVEGADRDLKTRVGWLAYALSALQALRDPQAARYHLTLDGQEVETEGLSCIVANSGMIGKTNWSLAPNISVSDGLLDVLVIRRADLSALLSMAASVVGGTTESEPVQHWQAREISVVSEPEQSVQCDGEMKGRTPIKASIEAQAIRFIVPTPEPQPAPGPAAAPAE
jgi:diacylglycerol kinase family enzyme